MKHNDLIKKKRKKSKPNFNSYHLYCICTISSTLSKNCMTHQTTVPMSSELFPKNKLPPKANHKLYHSSSLQSVESNASSLIVPAPLYACFHQSLSMFVHAYELQQFCLNLSAESLAQPLPPYPPFSPLRLHTH